MSKDSPAAKLFSHQMVARKKIRAKFKKDAGDLLDAHELSFSAIAQIASRFGFRRFEKQTAAVEGRMNLTAQFVQGVDVCETAIVEGLYSQAAALLKQEMETIEAVHEFEQGQRKEGRTPRIGGRLEGFGPVYGQYNEVAHVSRDAIAGSLVHFESGGFSGPSTLPVYNSEIAISFYGMHTYFVFVMAGQIHSVFFDVFSEGMNDEEAKWLSLAAKILVKEDIIAPVKELAF